MRPLVTNLCLAVISMSNCYRYFWCLRIKNVTGIGLVRYVRHGTVPVIWYLNVSSSPAVGGQTRTCELICPVLLIQSVREQDAVFWVTEISVRLNTAIYCILLLIRIFVQTGNIPIYIP